MKCKSENQVGLANNPDEDHDVGEFVIVEGCDVAIANAIEHLRKQVTKSHTLNSRQYPLLSLVKKLLDQPVAEFLKEHCPSWGEFRISDSLRNSATVTREAVRQMIHEYETDDVTYATLETLVFFSKFCEGREGNEPVYETFCELCWKLTEYEETLWKPVMALGVRALIYRGYDQCEVDKGFSRNFCAYHHPRKQPSAYRSAHAQKERFQSELKWLADWFVDQRIAPLPNELRKIAFLRAHPKESGKQLAEIAQCLVNSYADRKRLLGDLLGDCERLKKLLEEKGDIVSVNANSDGRVFFRSVDGQKFQALPASTVERNAVISRIAHLVGARYDSNNPTVLVGFPDIGMTFSGTVIPVSCAPAFSIRLESPQIYLQAAQAREKI